MTPQPPSPSTRYDRRYILLVTSLLLCLAPVVSAADPVQPSPSDDRQHLESRLVEINAAISQSPSARHHERAGILFRLGRFDEAIADYDTAARHGAPHDDNSCWERGLAQYYAGQFREGAEQFARYHRVGALDIENGLWRLICIAHVDGLEKARATIFDYPRKLRPPFPALLDRYLGTGSAEAVMEQARENTASPEEAKHRLFYAHYYLGKYEEILGHPEKAREHFTQALAHPINHFMYACAQIDARRHSATHPRD